MSVMDKLINAMKFNEDPYDDENEAEAVADKIVRFNKSSYQYRGR